MNDVTLFICSWFGYNESMKSVLREPENEIGNALALLGYDPRWLEYGFLSRDTLREQSANFCNGEDKNTEHYRYFTFRQILTSRLSLSDGDIAHYVALTQYDPDTFMAEAALCDLIMWPKLKPEQFNVLSQSPPFATKRIQKLVRRKRLLTELDAAILTPATFERCLQSGDSAVHRRLLCRADLTHEQASLLAAQGASRAIRNIAVQRAGGKFRSEGDPKS